MNKLIDWMIDNIGEYLSVFILAFVLNLVLLGIVIVFIPTTINLPFAFFSSIGVGIGTTLGVFLGNKFYD